MGKKQIGRLVCAISLVLAGFLAACGPEAATEQPSPAQATAGAAEPTEGAGSGQTVTTASGLQYVEVKKGEGPAPQVGDVVSVHYRGTLEDGTEFDNSYTRGEPIKFALGRGMVIAGWDEGIALMSVGGKAKLIIPPELAYGEKGAGDVIPANATLVFEVELVDAQPGSPASPQKVSEGQYTTTTSGLKYYDLQLGDGSIPAAGKQVSVHYTGWLADGTKFDSSIDRGEPIAFVLGAGEVIPGMVEGISTMKVGGKRQLVIPAELAYGENGAGGVIPPNATLIFEVELLGVQ